MNGDDCVKLKRKKHIKRLIEGLRQELPAAYQKLVPAQTWTVYWIAQSLALLDQESELKTSAPDIIEFIKQCASPSGGYGGGPGQIGHLATTYAAVNALITLSDDNALESIDRTKMIQFLREMKQPDGSFTMHHDGEIDSRASYCALAVLRCLNIEDADLTSNVADWLLNCQTYEGGFSSLPGCEAHGGYTFCCVAALCLLNQLHRCDIESLLRWLTNKQLTLEGGFCGRSNKLVDSCYSFWQGAVVALIHPLLFDKEKSNEQSQWIFDCFALQEFILDSCQAKGGLLRDKPEAPPDFYHTCYALGGLSISQYGYDGKVICNNGGYDTNLLAPTNPLFNVTPQSLNHCYNYFKNKKICIKRKE